MKKIEIYNKSREIREEINVDDNYYALLRSIENKFDELIDQIRIKK